MAATKENVRQPSHDPLLSRLVGFDDFNRPLVEHPYTGRTVVAKFAIESRELSTDTVGRQLVVLLAAEGPIIMGIVREALEAAPSGPKDVDGLAPALIVDGRQVQLPAKSELVLRCGASSITLTKEGKIVIRGTKIVSRASGENSVKGACVKIN